MMLDSLARTSALFDAILDYLSVYITFHNPYGISHSKVTCCHEYIQFSGDDCTCTSACVTEKVRFRGSQPL